MLSVSLWWKHYHATGYEKYQSPPAPRKNCLLKSISSVNKGLLRLARLETGTSNAGTVRLLVVLSTRKLVFRIIPLGMNFITTGLL